VFLINSYLKTFTNGIIKENPALVMLLGMCPALAVTTTAANGLGMGLATMFVLICSNVAISLLKNIIPNQVRLPCYIIIIAGFVTFVKQMLEAFIPWLYDSLGLFLPLIAVNCIIFGRAEAFASRNNPLKSAVDGAGMGIGFTLALLIMGSVREILGSGTLMAGTALAMDIPGFKDEPIILFVLPAGGFLTYGLIIAVMNKIMKKPARDISCETCPSKSVCKKYSDKQESK